MLPLLLVSGILSVVPLAIGAVEALPPVAGPRAGPNDFHGL